MSTFDRDRFRDDVKARVNLEEWIRRDGVPLTGSGREFKACCPFHLEKSPSFTVFEKEGGWAFHCFGCTVSGDIFEWVMKRKGLDFPQALKLVANEMGMSMPDGRIYQPREVREAATSVSGPPSPLPSPPGEGAPAIVQPFVRAKPFDPEKFSPLQPTSRAARYLVEKRGLSLEWLARYSVGQTADGEAYAFAYKHHPPTAKHPRFEFCKVVKVDRADGKKVEWREPKGGKNILFGMLAVPADCTRLVIAEGEIDAITWAQYLEGTGIGAVSVPGGAGYLGWIEVCWDWLQRFKSIHVSFDEDRAGRQKVVEVVQRLGNARTDMVRLPEREAEVVA